MSLNDLSLKSNVLGRDGAHPFIAKVVPAKYWKPKNDLFMITGLPSARCKIRVVGDDPPSKTELPDEDCRWALIASPPGVGGGSGGRGETISYVGGEMVGGYYADGADRQQPIITHTFPAAQKVATNDVDTSNLEASAFDDTDAEDSTDSTDSTTFHGFLNDFPIESNEFYDFDGHLRDKNSFSFSEAAAISVQGGGLNILGDAMVLNSTNDYFAFTPCGNDTVSRTKKLLEGFIEKSNSFEERSGKIIDPLTNEVVNMQYDLQVIQEQVSEIMKGSVNLIRKKIVKNINKAIKDDKKKEKTTSGGINEAQNNKEKVKKNKALQLVSCIFDGIFDSIGDFIGNMFTNLLNNVLNGALCAIEQFVAGIFAKVFDAIENGLSKIMGALSFLSGGLDKIKGLLRNAAGMAKDLLDFLDKCLDEEEKCINLKNLSWSSTSNSSKEEKKDDIGDQIKKVNFFRGIKDGLGDFKDRLSQDEDVENLDYNGVPISKTIKATSLLTGGSSNRLLDKGLGTIESAISQSSIFGLGNNRFSACNNAVDNPNSQDDLTPTRPGYIYPKCIPPVVKVSGSGSGAELFAIVGNDRRIFSIEVISGGSGYDETTGLSVVDNTGNGVGAYARPIVSNGVITQVVLMKTGYGYCLNTKDNEVPSDVSDGVPSVGIGTNVVGTVEDIFVEQPGYNYDSNDTISVGDSNFPIITTPGGSIVDVIFPSDYNYEFDSRANITINTSTGFAAKLIPIMKFKGQLKTDANADKRKAAPLIGIDNVVDCIGDNRDPVGFVNGVEYSGPYHVMSSGVKMTGATHGVSDSIIYDTIQESLSNPVVSASSYETPTETETETSTPVETTTVDTTPTIVTTPTTPTMDTNTTTDTSTSTGTDTDSSGGGGYGGY
jgi:hypothetical protein